jgi:heptosyltransferase-1
VTRSLLVVKLGALGDILLALPAVERLKRHEPELKVSWLVEARHRSVLEGHPLLEELISIDTQAWRRAPASRSTWREVLGTFRRLRERRFDVAVDLQGLIKSAVWARWSGASLKLGFPAGAARERLAGWLVPRRPRQAPASAHVSELAAAILSELHLGVELEPLQPSELPLSEEERQWAIRFLSEQGLTSFVVLNPGAAWVTKRWQPERYLEVARWLLKNTEQSIFVSWGPGEQELAEAITLPLQSERVVSSASSVRELAAIVEHARLFVGSDTGPYHVARSMGVPTLALFGPTDPARNGPFEERGSVLWGKVACSPCYGRRCPTEIECMDSLSVETVIERLKHLLR